MTTLPGAGHVVQRGHAIGAQYEVPVFLGLATHELMTGSQPVPILLMADYSADPLWRRNASGETARLIALNLDTPPLSTTLEQDLRAWAARFDALSETG